LVVFLTIPFQHIATILDTLLLRADCGQMSARFPDACLWGIHPMAEGNLPLSLVTKIFRSPPLDYQPLTKVSLSPPSPPADTFSTLFWRHFHPKPLLLNNLPPTQSAT
jgi:hypothetical protein